MKGLLMLIVLCATFVAAPENMKAQNSKMGKELRHVVLVKFKDSESASNVEAACAAFQGLKEEIPLIQSFEWGENNSPEGLNQGLTHCFIATFHSESDRDAYLIHPAHKVFVKEQGPKFDKVTVVDYWVK